MRKIILSMTMALLGVSVAAQESLPYDEETLLGYWSARGDIMEVGSGAAGPVAVGGLSLNANKDSYVSWNNPVTGYYSSISYTTFFLSGNKLHLISSMPTQTSSLTFVITWLEFNNEAGCCFMYLRPMGAPKDKEYLLMKQGVPNQIQSVSSESRTSDEKYSISGFKVENPKIPYVQNGKIYLPTK